jgi:hypothetical protein
LTVFNKFLIKKIFLAVSNPHYGPKISILVQNSNSGNPNKNLNQKVFFLKNYGI